MSSDKLNIKELRQLQAYFKQAPVLFKRAGVKYINMLAWELKKAIEITLQRNFEIRNERFIFNTVRVQNMRRSTGSAEVGTINKPRYTGFKDSDEGGHKLENAMTLNARGGDYARQSIKQARLIKNKRFYNQNNFPVRNRAGSQEKRAAQMLAVAHKTNYTKPFIMRGHIDINPGLFVFQQGKLKRLRKFRNEPRIRHVPWMKDSIYLTQRTHRPGQVWRKAIKKVGADKYK